MPNDAKLGLVAGVGLVIVVAVVFFRKDVPIISAAGVTSVKIVADKEATWRAGQLGLGAPEGSPRRLPVPVEGRSHTVRQGETLVSLARQYYGDAEKSTALFHANRDRLRAPDHIPTGTVLVIPDLADLVLAEGARRE